MLQTVTEWFAKPAGQRFVKEMEHNHSIAVLEERKRWATEIQSAEEKLQSVLPGLLKAEAKLEEQREEMIKRHREELAHMNKRLAAETQQRAQATAERDRVVGSAERSLRTTASPKIDEFWRALERRRHDLGSGAQEYGKAHDGREIIVRSNYPSLQRAALRIGSSARSFTKAGLGTTI